MPEVVYIVLFQALQQKCWYHQLTKKFQKIWKKIVIRNSKYRKYREFNSVQKL